MTEILVVVAAIALLLGLLLPSLLSSRQRSKTLACTSNVRQLALGLAAYETEHGAFPHALNDTRKDTPPGGYPGHSAFDRAGWWWFNHITKYSIIDSNKNGVLWCPSRHVTDSRLKSDILCSNYGVNLSLCKNASGLRSNMDFVGTPLGAADIPSPSDTLLVVDSGYSMISWWHAIDTPPRALGKAIEDAAYIPGLHINKDGNLWPGQELDAIEGRHQNKRINVGFADAHVTCIEAEHLLVEKTGDAYKNLRPLWVPK